MKVFWLTILLLAVAPVARARSCALIQLVEGGSDIRLALKRGANPDCRDAKKRTPLHRAAYLGRSAAVDALLAAGAEVNAIDGSGSTALESVFSGANAATGGGTIAARDRSFAAIVDSLLAKGARAGSKGGDYVIYNAAYWGNLRAFRAIFAAGVARIDNGEYGKIALHLACAFRKPDLLLFLLENGADLKALNHESETAMGVAANSGCIACVRMLLNKGADPNSIGNKISGLHWDGAGPSSETALMTAVRRGDLPMVRMLLDAGARVRKFSRNGETVLDLRSTGKELSGLLETSWRKEMYDHSAEAEPVKAALNAIDRRAHNFLVQEAPGIDLQMIQIVHELWDRWQVMSPDSKVNQAFAVGLTRLAYAFEFAVHNGDRALAQSVREDLATKLEDCQSRTEGFGGEVKMTIKTFNGKEELGGWKVKWVEKFWWDIRAKLPSFDTYWHEFDGHTKITDEPIRAGNIVIEARFGPLTSPAKPVDVSAKREREIAIAVH